jgi:hypothetical protein
MTHDVSGKKKFW